MAQFDVYINPNRENADLFPYFVDIQNDFHDTIKTRVVIPLTTEMKAFTRLTPIFTIGGQKLTLSIAEIASIPLSVCGKKVDNLEAHSSEIFDALDFLVHGF